MFSSSLRLGLSGMVASGLAIAAMPQSSQAAPYIDLQSSSGTTRLIIRPHEDGHFPQWQVEYSTQLKNETWLGSVKPLRVNGHDGERTILGTFKDTPRNPRSPDANERFCAGEFSLTQNFRDDRAVAKVTWHITGGKNCEAIGQKINMNVAEALPIATASGDFTDKNTDTWAGLNSGQNDFHTWDQWQVVDPSNKLNCRQWPNGKIVKTYQRGDQLKARYDGRGTANAILGSDNVRKNPSLLTEPVKGDPWLQTTDNCFVRSNSQYIKPLSALAPFEP